MKTTLASLVTLLAASAVSGSARADDVAPGATSDPTPAPAAAVTAPATAGWPQAMADRPYNLDAGMFELHGAMPFASAEGDETEILVGVGASYGITNAVEVGADYAFELRPSADAAGVLSGHVRLRLAHTPRFSASFGASILYSDSLASDGVVLGTFGISARYRFNKQLSIFTDSNLCAGCINVAGPVMGQGIVAYESGSNGSSSSTLVAIALPIGVAYQATPQVYVSAATVVGAFELSPDTASAFLFNDLIPVIASVWFSPTPKLDLGLSVTDDLKNAGDNYFFELGAKFRP